MLGGVRQADLDVLWLPYDFHLTVRERRLHAVNAGLDGVLGRHDQLGLRRVHREQDLLPALGSIRVSVQVVLCASWRLVRLRQGGQRATGASPQRVLVLKLGWVPVAIHHLPILGGLIVLQTAALQVNDANFVLFDSLMRVRQAVHATADEILELHRVAQGHGVDVQ